MDDDVRPLDDAEYDWLKSAVDRINSYLAKYYFDEEGEGRLDRTERDLKKAQEVFENERFTAAQKSELLALGAVLGNVLATNTRMEWAVVTNEFGTNLGLWHPDTGFVLYPLSMIVKRVEVGRTVDIPALYRSFVADLGLSSSG